MQPLRIGFVSSEVAPFSKAGGLADVSGALGRYVAERGHEIRIFTPLYATIPFDKYQFAPVEFLRDVPVSLGPHFFRFSVYTAQLPETETWAYFIHCPELYDRPQIYTNDEDEHLRFLLLCHAFFRCCQYMSWSPQIVHTNDWQTAPIPLLKRTEYAWDHLFSNTKSILTIHNIGYQGVFSSSILSSIVSQEHAYLIHQDDLRAGHINFMKTGLLFADSLTTVSPTYAREIQTPDFAAGLETILLQRRDDLTGILNGVDYRTWSPESDPYIEYPYGTRNPVAGKEKNKEALLTRYGLPYQPRRPLAGIVSRLVLQKGFELVVPVLGRMLREHDFQLFVLGSGEEWLENAFRGLQDTFPHQVRFHSGYSEALAHQVEAASNFFLMPSLYEPCGLNQMYSLKYGAAPVVRRTGGLADTVVPFDPEAGTGTGFVFEHFTPAGFEWAFTQGLRIYQDRKLWLQLVRNAMAEDFSWASQVDSYLELYEDLAGE